MCCWDEIVSFKQNWYGWWRMVQSRRWGPYLHSQEGLALLILTFSSPSPHKKLCGSAPPPPILCCYQGFWSDSIQIKKLGLSQRRIGSIVNSTVDFLYFRIVWFGLRMVRPAIPCTQVLRQVITSIPLLLYFHLGQLLSVVALVQM